ncbi:MAG: hypothetical protein K6B69_08305, partial [Lachnospiraceae bacterium]|nr:hypothetical protein [Lachnospiraceae bacterium]
LWNHNFQFGIVTSIFSPPSSISGIYSCKRIPKQGFTFANWNLGFHFSPPNQRLFNRKSINNNYLLLNNINISKNNKILLTIELRMIYYISTGGVRILNRKKEYRINE